MLAIKIFSLILWIKYCFAQNTNAVYNQPEQVHISSGANETQMIVTWTTFNTTQTSKVEYGLIALDNVAYGNVTQFTDGGSAKRVLFIHRVTITGLQPGEIYQYHCGSSDGWSNLFKFRAMQSGSDWSPNFIIFGDLGNLNAVCLSSIQEEVQNNPPDVILNVGDFAYDMDSDNATVGDQFMRQIEPIAANVPFQVCAGNHEQAYNFSNYNNRFSMNSTGNNNGNNFFWSYNYGPVHVISSTSEFYYFTGYGTNQIQSQYNWLEKDLIEANKPENRALRPWIISMCHRPMYFYTMTDDIIRLGYIPYNQTKPKYGFEDLFYKYGVDLQFWGHVHNYERSWPVYNLTVYNGSLAEPYKNPKAPVHIITGSAGNLNGVSGITPAQNGQFIAFSNSDYSYTRMTPNKTQINIQQVSQNGTIIDKFSLIKENPVPYWLQ